MEKKILTLPPSLNECKKLNIIFPSSAPSKDIYFNGLQILETEIKKRYSETSDVEIYVNNIIANKISQHPYTNKIFTFLADTDEKRIKCLIKHSPRTKNQLFVVVEVDMVQLDCFHILKRKK